MKDGQVLNSSVLTAEEQISLREQFQEDGYVKINQAFSGNCYYRCRKRSIQMVDRSLKVRSALRGALGRFVAGRGRCGRRQAGQKRAVNTPHS